MRVTETKNNFAVLLLYSVTYAYDLELLLIALSYANDHVVKKGSGKTVKRTVFLLVIGTGNGDLITLLRDGELAVEGLAKLAKRTLYYYVVACVNSYGYACGYNNRFSTNS